jgi:hypothetical protein
VRRAVQRAFDVPGLVTMIPAAAARPGRAGGREVIRKRIDVIGIGFVEAVA